MVVEIPKGTQAKLEINKKEKYNPIKHDIKNGKVRYVGMKYPGSYGALSQTWENPGFIDKYTKSKGDNDPIDVFDLSSIVGKTGEIKQIKILGIFAMIDEGETDWKVIGIDVNDDKANKINDLEDVDKYLPGKLNDIYTFLRDYKIPDGKPPNKFAFDGKPQNRDFAIKIINETHHEWEKLINGEVKSDDISIYRALNGKNKSEHDFNTLLERCSLNK